MKSAFFSTLAAFISLQTASADITAPFYTWPNVKSAASGSPEVLTHNELRLSLASRLGLSQFHHIGTGVGIYKLQRIGSSQQRLWTDKHERDGTVMVTIGGVANPDAFSSESPIFFVENSPSFSSVGTLVNNFKEQSENVIESTSSSLYSNAIGSFIEVISPAHNSAIDFSAQIDQWSQFESAIGKADASNFKSTDKSDVNLFEEYMALKALADRTISQVIAEKATIYIHLGCLEAIHLKDGVNSKKYKVASKIVAAVLNDMIKAISGYPSIVGFLPPSTRVAKRSDIIGEFEITKVKRKEAPLSPPQPSATAETSIAEEETSPMSPFQKTAIARPKPGCFKSLSDCKKTTNQCNGRGDCMLSTVQSSCWSCKCNATVITDGGKTKTTYWGGNACQKKDVSVPFLLFVTFGTGMVLILTWTIGKLMSMGEEELPGELTAGVAIVKKG